MAEIIFVDHPVLARACSLLFDIPSFCESDFSDDVGFDRMLDYDRLVVSGDMGRFALWCQQLGFEGMFLRLVDLDFGYPLPLSDVGLTDLRMFLLVRCLRYYFLGELC